MIKKREEAKYKFAIGMGFYWFFGSAGDDVGK